MSGNFGKSKQGMTDQKGKLAQKVFLNLKVFNEQLASTAGTLLSWTGAPPT